jgi:hypothetical protein
MDTNDIQRATEIQLDYKSEIKYSICTLMTRKDEYQEMVNSFIEAGFNLDFTEFLYIDNSVSNNADAYKGLNFFLQKSRGEYIILCHQDILICYDKINNLEVCIENLDQLDENWAIMANAGASGIKGIVYRLYEPNNLYKSRGNPIQKVTSVDENFILVKKSANLSLSGNMNGFHLYGTDLCIIANILGYNAYVVEFNLLHKSKGNVNSNFYDIKKDLQNKYTKSLNGHYIQTTCTNFYLSGNKYINWFLTRRFTMFFVRNYYSIKNKFNKSANDIPKSEW